MGCHGLNASRWLCPAHVRGGRHSTTSSLCSQRAGRHTPFPQIPVSGLNHTWRALPALPAVSQEAGARGPFSGSEGIAGHKQGMAQKTGQATADTRNTRSWAGSQGSRLPGAGWQPLRPDSPHPRQDVPMMEGPGAVMPPQGRPVGMARDGQTWTLCAEGELFWQVTGVWLSSALAGSLGTPLYTVDHTGRGRKQPSWHPEPGPSKRMHPQPFWVLTWDLEHPPSLLESITCFHNRVLTRGLTRAQAYGRMRRESGPFSYGPYWELPSSLGLPDSRVLPPPCGTNAGSRPWLSHRSPAMQASL